MPLTQEQLDALVPKWRTVTHPAVGSVQVRGPTYRDVVMATRLDRPDWWLENCVRMEDGTALFPPGTDFLEVNGGLVRFLENEVFSGNPTRPPTGG